MSRGKDVRSDNASFFVLFLFRFSNVYPPVALFRRLPVYFEIRNVANKVMAVPTPKTNGR